MLVSRQGDKSRPVVREWFIEDPAEFDHLWRRLTSTIDAHRHVMTCTESEANRALYTAVLAVAIAFDLWKPTSRKTPGTYFELVLGSLLGSLLPTYKRSKHVPLGVEKESISTDIVFTRPDNSKSLVFAAKITTRERVVQPFAHQRILDSRFGEGKYVSILTCVSETQRDGKRNRANMICVPRTIRLFQQHLARLGGIYYLDPPARYLAEDVRELVPVGTLGHLLTIALPTLA